MRARKLYNFPDQNLDRQVQEICSSQILPDLGGTSRKWVITGVNVTVGDDGKEYLAIGLQET